MPASSTYSSPTVTGSQAPRGLKALLRQRLNTALTCGPPNTWKALVVDAHARELLESAYKVFEVLHMNVTCEYRKRWASPVKAKNEASMWRLSS